MRDIKLDDKVKNKKKKDAVLIDEELLEDIFVVADVGKKKLSKKTINVIEPKKEEQNINKLTNYIQKS